MTVLQTIRDALIEIGVASPNEDIEGEDIAYALRTFNRIIDFYHTQSLVTGFIDTVNIPAPLEDVTDPNSPRVWKGTIDLQRDYPSQGFNLMEITGAFSRITDTDYPMRPMTQDIWENNSYKNNFGIPQLYWVRPNGSGSFKISFDLVPTQDISLFLMAKKRLDDGAGFELTDEPVWDTGVERMLFLRTAVELCETYKMQPSQTLMVKAAEAEAAVKTYNHQPKTLESSPELTGRRRWGCYNPARQ